MSSIQKEICYKCETEIDTEEMESCDCVNCDEEVCADCEIYRHYECCECEKDIEAVGRRDDNVLCLECEEKKRELEED